jgi:hypothetical protein
MFVVLIFLIAASSVFSYHLAEDRYNQLVNERGQSDWERYNERLLISSAMRLLTGALNSSIQNVGAVAAHLVTLYVSAYDAANSPQWQHQYSIDIWIGAGTVKYNFGQNSFTYTPITPGYINQPVSTVALNDASSTYIIKLVTERGNIATYILPPGGEPQLAQVQIVPGSMEISYDAIKEVWDQPRINYTSLKSSVEGKYFAVRAKFVNNSKLALRVRTGSILFQYCFASANNKVLGFGGRLYKCGNILVDSPSPGGTEVEWLSGVEFTLTFRCDIYVWSTNDLSNMFSTSIKEVAWLGSASIASRANTNPMTTAAVVVDGLLVTQSKTW